MIMLTFTIDANACDKMKKWMKKEDAKTRKMNKGAIGGEYVYSFFPTGIGTVIRVENTITNAVIDLTDYNSW